MLYCKLLTEIRWTVCLLDNVPIEYLRLKYSKRRV